MTLVGQATGFGQHGYGSASVTGGKRGHAARREKLAAVGFITLWTGAGTVLEIWSWEKQGARGQRKAWVLRREAL